MAYIMDIPSPQEIGKNIQKHRRAQKITQKEFAKIALDGLTVEEKRICKEVFHKICENADKYMR